MFEMPPPPPPSYDVVRWASMCQEEISRAPLGPNDLTTAEFLSLIHIETRGQPDVYRPTATYRGLTQVGGKAIREAYKWSLRLDWSGDLSKKLLRRGRPDPRVLHNNGPLAARTWVLLYWVYRKRHEHRTDLTAVFWKGGPGTLRGYKRILKRRGRRAANRHLRSKSATIPRGVKYLKSFERWERRYQEHVNMLNARYGICSSQLEEPGAFTLYTPVELWPVPYDPKPSTACSDV